MKKGFTLIELLTVTAIVAILVTIATTAYQGLQDRSKISQVVVDQRTLGTALTAYYVDYRRYPVSARVGREPIWVANINSFLPHSPPSLAMIDSFSAQQNSPQRIATLTTPIAYINSYPTDPFMDTKGATYAYFAEDRMYSDWTDPSMRGWILWSPGPNRDQQSWTDLGRRFSVETVYSAVWWQEPTPMLIAGTKWDCFTYDPTNGTVSPGDIWRIK